MGTCDKTMSGGFVRFLIYGFLLTCVVVTFVKIFRPNVPNAKSTKNATEACTNMENAMAALIQSEVTVHSALATLNGSGSGIQYPATLDDAQDGYSSSTNKFFTKVIEGGMEGNNWAKKGNEYFHTCEGKTKTFVYNPWKGTFVRHN